MSAGRNWLVCVVVLILLFTGVTFLPPAVYLGAALIAFGLGRAASMSDAAAPPPQPAGAMSAVPISPSTTTAWSYRRDPCPTPSLPT